MTVHLSARLAWHMDGWNGRICDKPSSNHYCIGPNSYPSDTISRTRNLEWEKSKHGKCCSEIDDIPPCICSINAFGTKSLIAYNDPPSFFGSGVRTKWELPPATVCVWPYEAMYDPDNKTNGKVDNFKRLDAAKEFFSAVEPTKSLVFHYANFSNPLSTDESRRYAIIGLSRIKKLGRIQFYDGTNEETKKNFGGAYVWQMNVETDYPDQGLRIPYHRYLERSEILENITLFPENPRCFKYGTRHISDDEALSLVERFIEIAKYLQTQGDDSENWTVRLQWLNSLIAELWQSRGLFPGFARVLDIVGLSAAIIPFRSAAAKGMEKDFHGAIFSWLDGGLDNLADVSLSSSETAKIRRQWTLRSREEQQMLVDLMPRFDLPRDQMERIIGTKRAENCLEVGLSDILDNPYVLSEQFVGDDPDDTISFSRIDHGVFPSPGVGGDFLYEIDDWRRLRALCVDRLKYETKHIGL